VKDPGGFAAKERASMPREGVGASEETSLKTSPELARLGGSVN
jgi:hypothetical protein